MGRPALESEAELAGMFDPGEFGQLATFTAPDGSSFDVDVIFDRVHYQAEVDAETHVSTSQPQVQGRTEDLTSVRRGFRVAVDGELFRVHERQDDGTGVTTILLHTDSA